MDNELSTELALLREAGLYRHLRRVESVPSPRVTLDGREVIVFGSNNYLGLSTHPDVRRAAAEAAETWGTGSSGSRLTTGNLVLVEELEADIAAFKGAEAALVFGTGYMAGIGAITALVRQGDLILSDALNHASLIDGCRLSRADIRVYRHNDIDHARELLQSWFADGSGAQPAQSELERSTPSTLRHPFPFRGGDGGGARQGDRQRMEAGSPRILIVTDGVFSMDGDIAPIAELTQLADEFDAYLMVDDAHGTGILGENGTGTLEHLDVDRTGIIQMGTLSKALGSEGGFIAGSRVLIDYLINRARPFIFSTAPAPPTIAAARAALRLVKSEPQRRADVLANAERLRSGLRQAGFNVPDGATPIVPVIIGDVARAAAFADALLERGIYAPAIRPPTVPPGTARLRMSVMATHTAEDIDTAVEMMVNVERDAGSSCGRQS